jgi:septal ring factor EnvC (AmiA/AmiB activator)
MANELTGNSGDSQASSGMYFEIRYHGEAQNPDQWFSD